MTNLILTPVYRSYEIVKECCDAIDKYSIYPFLHILVDDDSGINEPFPAEPTPNRRIILLKRDYIGIIHKNGGAQAMQLALDYAKQLYFNEKPNPVYDNVFLIEADVIVREEWDKKMLEVKETLPEDWLSLDQQSIDKEGKLTYPTTVSPRLGWEREDLEITKYPDFQTCLFSPRLLKKIKFSDYPSHFDVNVGNATEGMGKHYRTTLVSSYHYAYSSRQFLSETPKA